MSNSLWPNFSSVVLNRGMREMLKDAAGDISSQTQGDIEVFIDTLGLSDVIDKIRHNCYLLIPKNNYKHLLFRVTTPVPGPWPAIATTPEGDPFPEMQDEFQLRSVIQQILNRDRTKEVVVFLLGTVR